MRNVNKINTEETTNVRNGVINYKTLDTEDRDDDRAAWNSMELYGDTDENEQSYRSPEKVKPEAEKRIRDKKIGFVSILGARRALSR